MIRPIVTIIVSALVAAVADGARLPGIGERSAQTNTSQTSQGIAT